MVFCIKSVAQDAVAGFERLELLNQTTSHYYNSEDRKARKYAKQGNLLADNILKSNPNLSIDEAILVIKSKQLYGEVLYNRESYLDAQSVFQTTRDVAKKFDYLPGEENSNLYLVLIDSLIAEGEVKSNFLTRALSDIDIASADWLSGL